MDGRRCGGLWQKTGFILGAGTQKAPRRRVLTAEPEVVNSEKSCHGRGSHGRAPKCIFLTINMWVPENDGKRRREGEEMQTTFSSTLIPAARQVHRFDGLAIISSHVRALPCALPPPHRLVERRLRLRLQKRQLNGIRLPLSLLSLALSPPPSSFHCGGRAEWT